MATWFDASNSLGTEAKSKKGVNKWQLLSDHDKVKKITQEGVGTIDLYQSHNK